MARTKAAYTRLLKSLDIDPSNVLPATHDGKKWRGRGPQRDVYTPIDDSKLATIRDTTPTEYEAVAKATSDAFEAWRMVPAPKRGEVVRLWGEQLRRDKEALGKLVSLEMGKSLQEGLGEVQEMIDICDFAVGLSRQLYGNTMHSERPNHRMYEQWHPLGVCGVISAFNFPVAVYAWNAAIALVCGNTVLWKPSEKTPLTAMAVQAGIAKVTKAAGHPHIATLVQGAGQPVGELLINDPRIALVSATGSCRMGRHVGQTVAGRMGRSILELGGNNGIIVAPSADLDLAIRAVLFGAVGTAGQRCTSTRRVFVHKSLTKAFMAGLQKAYKQVTVGSPLDESNLMGPLIDADAVATYKAAVAKAKEDGAKLLVGGQAKPSLGQCYVSPALFDCTTLSPPEFPLALDETFAPLLYVFSYESEEQVMGWHNGVKQGLSSALFTRDLQEAERFLSHAGSDCGIANINIGTSGAEIGGAFGGEKETGGGREAGSDSWKQYMRRQTNTINWGNELPLAQGIKFDL